MGLCCRSGRPDALVSLHWQNATTERQPHGRRQYHKQRTRETKGRQGERTTRRLLTL